jgi:hypothetical protein
MLQKNSLMASYGFPSDFGLQQEFVAMKVKLTFMILIFFVEEVYDFNFNLTQVIFVCFD